MSESWTNHQIQAINTTGCNLLVAAAAGSGKTAVLVQRIVKMVTREDEKSVDIDRLLVMTFTNAAASEMRERLGIELAKALSENPNSTRLQSQMVLLNKASISTIHSFCLQVIKNNFHKLDLDPVFRIGDETEILLLKQEAVEEMLEDYYSSEEVDENFISLVENYSGNKNDNVIQELIFDLYNFSMSLPWPKKWLLDSAEVFNVKEDFDFGKSIWGKTILENTTIEVKGLRSMMEKALKVIDNESSIEGYRVSFQEEINMLSGLCDCIDLDDMMEKLKVVTFARLKAVKNPNQFAKDRVQEIRNKVKKRIAEISKELTSSTNESIIETMVKLYPTMKCLVELVINFDKVFKDKKKERGIIDFNDIEHFCLDLLCTIDDNGEITPSETALEYRKKFSEVLVDEYQDCNMVQEVIMSMVSRKDEDTPNLFMVGDVKQSIYRFRHARPELFLEKYNSYLETEDASSRKIMLFKNFRSKKGIIEGVNYIFNKIMSKTLGELNYDENEALNFGAEYYYENDYSELKTFDEAIELNVVEKNSKVSEDNEVDDEMQEALDKIQLEAKLVAQKILGILDYYIYDKSLKKYRKIEFRDIVILLRTTAGWCEVFMEELKNSNIPVYSDTGTGYFDTIEIKTMMSLLQIIDNPLQDIPMLSVLRSPIFGFTPEELIDIKNVKKKIYVYEEIKEACKDNGDISKDLVEKCRNFLKKLSYWRKKSHTTPIDEFVWYLYTDTGYYGYTGAMPGGVQRQANLRLLFQRAKQFGETSFKGVFNFILFIGRLRTSSGDMGSAKILSENENVVRIMSIHKSKGLEFPVVILSGLGKKFNLMDMNKKILFHQELGLAPDFVDYKRRISYPTEIKNALKSKLTNETLSEEMRILYVAMTRAKEKLILTGVTKNYIQEVMKWGEGIDEGGGVSKYYILKNTCFLRWIGAAIIAHGDCEDIRRQSGTDFCDSYNHGSKWKVINFSESDFKHDSTETQENNFSLEQYCNNEKGSYFEEIQRRLTHTYPYVELTKLPGKISVSEIKKRFQTFDENSEKIFVPELKKIPNFLTDKKLTPSEKGTAMHTVMQHINLKGDLDYDGIKLQIHELVIKDILTEKQAESIKVRNIARLFTSELGKRMIKSKSVNREATFQIKVPAGEIYPELQSSRYNKCEIIVQGAIDCYFYEGDEIVILDYKTDYVDETNKNDIIEKYRIQLDYYQRAIGKITGSKVKEKYIYLFYTGEFVRIECK